MTDKPLKCHGDCCNDPYASRDYNSGELVAASTGGSEELAGDNAPYADDDNLPGMWEHSDFLGGQTESR